MRRKKPREFVSITNEQIYEKVCEIAEKVDRMNGTVRNNTRMIWALWGVVGVIITTFITFLFKFV